MASLAHWLSGLRDGLSPLWSLHTPVLSAGSSPLDPEYPPPLTADEMDALQAQTHDDAYPVMPHAPVIVAAASCEDVMLRWRSIGDDTDWPIHGYIVQRFPDANHQLDWTTLVDNTNAGDTTDRNVKDTHQYLYRVQAVSGGARSVYAYQSVSMNPSACAANRMLLAYLPTALHSVPYLGSLSIDAVQTFVLIISCFLTVFGLVRSNVRRVQHTQSRKGRLREMKKATMAETSASKLLNTNLPRLSSSDVSTEPATSITDQQSQSRLESSPSVGAMSSVSDRRGSLGRHDSTPRAASFSASLDKSVCPYCNKKFGLFRRRRVCDVCEAVVLCRKCGSHAPAECSVHALRESLHANQASDTNTNVVKTNANKKLRARRVKTICRDCGEHALRLSTGLRPATARPLR